jgi:hypothetical protein
MAKQPPQTKITRKTLRDHDEFRWDFKWATCTSEFPRGFTHGKQGRMA